MCQTRNGYLHNKEKAESILFSGVVQRYSGDEKVIRWQNSFSQFRRTTRDWSHSVHNIYFHLSHDNRFSVITLRITELLCSKTVLHEVNPNVVIGSYLVRILP